MMRANRLMGASLVEHNLVKIEDLDGANERLLEVVAQGQARQSTVLGILAYEMKVVSEEDVLQYFVEQEGGSAIDLKQYEVPEEYQKGVDTGACWATWSVPFDREEDFHFIASAYTLSPAVKKYWETQLDGPVLWFGTTLEGIADYLEKIEPVGIAAPTAI